MSEDVVFGGIIFGYTTLVRDGNRFVALKGEGKKELRIGMKVVLRGDSRGYVPSGFSPSDEVTIVDFTEPFKNGESDHIVKVSNEKGQGWEGWVKPSNIESIIPTSPNNLTIHRYKRTNKSYTEDLGGGVTLTLMLIPADEFSMGAPPDEPESQNWERPQHRVQISQFLMGRYPVTQAQWRAVAGYPEIKRNLKPEPSRFKGNNRPVESVSWEDAQEFCQRLSAQTGKDYRLPSEAQWEYACRAGTTTPFHFGETITTELANYNGNYTYNGGPQGKYRQETTEVGIFPANDWGLCDMHGNVWEWCEDNWRENYNNASKDNTVRVEHDVTNALLLRGGSWGTDPSNCRSAARDGNWRVNFDDKIGFRVCCVAQLFLEAV